MVPRPLRALALLLALAACAAPQRPSYVRGDLGPQWYPNGKVLYPPHDGFEGAATPIVLPPGSLIDRFGGDGGQFFSPKGAKFAARALPSVCQQQPYNVYRVTLPLVVLAGPAVPWFEEPGGAVQLRTDAPVSLLLADHVIERVANPGPAPCS